MLTGEEGTALLEYGLLASLIAAACVLAVTGFGASLRQYFVDIASQYPR